MHRFSIASALSLLAAVPGCGGTTHAPGDGSMDAAADSRVDRDTGAPPADSGPRPDRTIGLPDAVASDGASADGAGGDGAPTDATALDAAADAGDGAITAASCFEGAFLGPELTGPDYDRFGPRIGSHCMGTNHQDIAGIERVVFLGDSVTVGTPPSLSAQFYRSLVADALASRFGLMAPSGVWKTANPLTGQATVQRSGDFSSCSEWGARTDDLLMPQIASCFAPADFAERTLVVMTVGGNDIAAITRAGAEMTRTLPELWDDTRAFVELHRTAIRWLTEPGRFPAGVFVTFGNMFEFTDGTGDTSSCPAAALAGFSTEWADPTALADMVIWANEQFLSIAVETRTDMIFMLEHFCGHGHNADDPTAPCYRGPGSATWFDISCIHPNPTGHRQIADMFLAVVNE